MNALFDHRIPPPLVALFCALGAWWFASVTKETPLAFGPVYVLTVLLCLKGTVIAGMGIYQFNRQRTTVNPLLPASASALVTGGIF
ncbi:MAG: isoprenylcysteine carboxylmethyltransferase family protein, partial [Pseudomonadales bacterium]